jgi:hypothetical protein
MTLDLYSDYHPKTSLKGTGYKDKKTALLTIKMVKYRSLRYQFDVINTMYNRAKYNRYKNNDMKEAMDIFSGWLKKYKDKKRREEKYKWLDYDVIKKYKKYITTEEQLKFYKMISKYRDKYYKLQYILYDDKYDYWSYRINYIKQKLKSKKIYKIKDGNKIITKDGIDLILHGYIR